MSTRRTITFLTDEQRANCDHAHRQAMEGNLLPRPEWEALQVPDAEHGRRVAHISNALRHRMLMGPVPIPLEWLEEFNELAVAQQTQAAQL